MYLIHQPIFDEYSILELALFFPLLSSDSNLKLLLTPCMTTEYEARLRFLAKLPTSHSREGIFFLEPYMIAEHCHQPSGCVLYDSKGQSINCNQAGQAPRRSEPYSMKENRLK